MAAAEPGNGPNGSPAGGEAPAPREYHSEPRESTPREPAPVAHFEPTPRHEAPAQENKPYVVWSSAPTERDSGGRGSEE